MRGREYNLTTSFGFTWEAPGNPDDLTRPSLTMELETGKNPLGRGKPVDTSMREDDVLNLWNSISSSIRLRKTGSGLLRDTRLSGATESVRQIVAH
jgi:hypothetical protein